MSRDFDSPWKETLDLFLQPILLMFFPDIHNHIDWSEGYESLDTELHAIVGDAELGATLADKMFRVHVREGADVWILIHLEVQSQPDPEFARRLPVAMFPNAEFLCGRQNAFSTLRRRPRNACNAGIRRFSEEIVTRTDCSAKLCGTHHLRFRFQSNGGFLQKFARSAQKTRILVYRH